MSRALTCGFYLTYRGCSASTVEAHCRRTAGIHLENGTSCKREQRILGDEDAAEELEERIRPLRHPSWGPESPKRALTVMFPQT